MAGRISSGDKAGYIGSPARQVVPRFRGYDGAESTLTRAQQAYLNSIHDYLIALVRLEYAMGVTPSPGNPVGSH